MKITYCKNCCMPNTKPGIKFSKEGVCSACIHSEHKKTIDWKKRWEELVKFCNKYRRKDGQYDCLITGSGGKDSLFQLYIMKKKLKMNPLLINVANFSYTKAGWDNFLNWNEVFGCDCLSLFLNRKVAKILTREMFKKMGSPNYYWDRATYTWPLQMAIKLNIPLVIYGENVNVEYGGKQKETYSLRFCGEIKYYK